MIALILFAALIAVLFFLPLSAISWVRANAGRLLGRVFGKARVSAASREMAVSGETGAIARASGAEEVSSPPPNKPIQWGRALGNILDFIRRFWWPLLLVLAFIIGVAVLRGWISPFDLGKSKADLRAELRESQAELQAKDIEAKISAYAVDRAERTTNTIRQIDQAVSEGQREIEHAATQDDFDNLYRAYADAYRSVLDLGPDARDADPAPARPSGLRSLGASPV